MAVRKGHVADMIRKVREHDAMSSARGYEASEQTDQAAREFRKLEQNATPEEQSLFKRIVG